MRYAFLAVGLISGLGLALFLTGGPEGDDVSHATAAVAQAAPTPSPVPADLERRLKALEERVQHLESLVLHLNSHSNPIRPIDPRSEPWQQNPKSINGHTYYTIPLKQEQKHTPTAPADAPGGTGAR